MTTPTREIFLNLSGWMQAVFYVLGLAACAVFGYGAWRRIRKYRKGRADPRFDRLGARVKRAAKIIVSNATVRRGDAYAGLAHAFVFWGFTVLFIGTVLVAIDHDFLRFLGVKMLQGWFYLGFSAALDLFGLVFIAGLVMLMVRRARFGLPKLDYRRADPRGGSDRGGFLADDRAFLWLLLVIAVTGYVIEGLRIAQSMPGFERWSPVGYGLAAAFERLLSPGALHDAHLWSWWIHGLFALAFVAYIPWSKAMHIFTDTANLVFADGMAARRLPPLPKAKPAEAGQAPKPAMGYAAITDFTWKELLDFDACTKCGRCHVACPAHAAGTTLSPRDLILDLRHVANAAFGTPEWGTERFGAAAWPATSDGAQDPLRVDVAKEVLRPETLWSCTSCMACVETCPVGIEHLTSIVQLRRHLVDAGAMDGNLQGALQNLGDYGNSFGESPKKRGQWTKGLPFKIKDARKEPVEYLWFVGDFASFDPRLQAVSRKVAEVFHAAGLDFGILYDGERNAGNDVRRVGEEGLFEMLQESNVEAFGKAQFKKIVTTDPHTLNTLRHEYPALDGTRPVLHYTQVLQELLASGRLKVAPLAGERVTYHDPCYLARYNRESDAPRAVLAALGAGLVEMPRNRENTFCCGAGGGRIWMDTANEKKRTSEQRIEEAAALGGVRTFVTACPKDFTMYSDAVKALKSDIQVCDLIDLVKRALAAAQPAAAAPADAARTNPTNA